MGNRERVAMGFAVDSELSNLYFCFKNETEGMYNFIGHGERDVLQNSIELSAYRSVEITLSKEYLFITDFRIIDLYQINSRF